MLRAFGAGCDCFGEQIWRPGRHVISGIVDAESDCDTAHPIIAPKVVVRQAIAQRLRVDEEIQIVCGDFHSYFMTSTASAAGSTLRSRSRATT